MSLPTRLAVGFAGVALVVSTTTGVLGYLATANRLTAEIDRSLADLATVTVQVSQARAGASRPAGNGGPGGNGGLLAGNGPSRDGGPIVGDEPGRSRFDPQNLVATRLQYPAQVISLTGVATVLTGSALTLPVDTADIELAKLANGGNFQFRGTNIAGQPYRLLTTALGRNRGALQIARSTAENEDVLASLAWLLVGIGAVVAVLSALAGWLLARRVTRRLSSLAKVADDVAADQRLDVAIDVTGDDEVARLARAIDAMLARLARSRADQQRLVQDAAHELRTPLTSLRTNIALVSRLEDLAPQQRTRVLEDLVGETREMTTLVDEIVALAMSSPQQSEPVPVPLGELAERVAARAIRRTGRQITVRADGSRVWADPGLLERAISNLVDNACKFDTSLTPIEVVVDNGALTVLDRGPGIPATDLGHVFDRFFRATDARSLPGSGLGLSIVADVVHSCGGQVTASQRQGGGAVVGFQLPVVANKASTIP